MTQLTINKENALKAFNAADSTGKTLLTNLFGKEVLSQDITERVQSFDDILAISGRTMESLINPGDEPDEIAYKQGKLIALVYNEGTVLQAKDKSQSKYYPWHEVVSSDDPSGFGLSYHDCDYWYSLSFVGVRLCFKNSKLAIDAGKKFIKIYETLKIR